MDAPVVTLRIPDLTRLDQLELRKQMGGDVSFATDPESGDQHGDLGIGIAIVIVSLSALKVLATFLARKHGHTSFRRTVELTRPDGTREKVTLEYDAASSEAAEKQVLEQLGKSCNVDVKSLLQAAGPGGGS